MHARIGPVQLRLEARGVRMAAHLLREERLLHKRARSMPRPVPWDWARPRLLPILAGPFYDPPDLPLVRTVSDLGCAVVFGIDMGGVQALVDWPVCERWECSTDQLWDAALGNLRRRAAEIPGEAVTAGTMAGHIVRFLRRPTGVASSVVLLPDEMRRLFGTHDQVFGTPSRSLLVSVPMTASGRGIGNILGDIEAGEALPLLLDPFLMTDGEVLWGGAIEDVEEEDEREPWR